MTDIFTFLADVGLGLAAFKLAYSVDKTQKGMLKVQQDQAKILGELADRVTKIEDKLR